MRRAVYVALLAVLVGVPAAAQNRPAAPQQPTVQKAAPVVADMSKLMLYELRIQQYADRISTAADRGEGMGIVYNSMNAISSCLKGGDAQLAALMAAAKPADAKQLAAIQKNHAAAHNAYQELGAELKKDPISRAAVLRTSYKLSDAAVRAQGKTPKDHPVIKVDAPKQ